MLKEIDEITHLWVLFSPLHPVDQVPKSVRRRYLLREYLWLKYIRLCLPIKLRGFRSCCLRVLSDGTLTDVTYHGGRVGNSLQASEGVA